MFNDLLIRIPINSTAAKVVNQRGCSDEMTVHQQKECLVSHMKQLDEQIKNLPKDMTRKDPVRKELGLRKFELCNQMKELNLKIKKLNIEISDRNDFTDCVHKVMREQLSSFQYNQIIRLAKDLYKKELESIN